MGLHGIMAPHLLMHRMSAADEPIHLCLVFIEQDPTVLWTGILFQLCSATLALFRIDCCHVFYSSCHGTCADVHRCHAASESSSKWNEAPASAGVRS